MKQRSRQTQRGLDFSALSDGSLLELTREGVSEAFGELWSRHHGAVVAATRSFTGYEPEDLAQEAFTRVYSSIMRGGELPASFRAYVASTSRRIAINRSVKERGVTPSSFEELADTPIDQNGDHAESVLEKSTTARAFKALPTRQREALWYRDVEDLPVKEVARYMGMSENATSVLIKRAREAFKASWITMQLSSPRGQNPECANTLSKMGRYARGTLTARDRGAVDLHIADCVHCAAIVAEADSLHKKLALVLLPMLLLGGAPSYLEWVQSGDNRNPVPPQANLQPVKFTSRGSGPAAAARAGVLGTTRLSRPAVTVAAGIVGVLVLGGGSALALVGNRAEPTSAASPSGTADASPRDWESSGVEGAEGPADQGPSASPPVSADPSAVPVPSGFVQVEAIAAPAPAAVLAPSPQAASGAPTPDPTPVPTPPVVYPDYREISTVTSYGPFTLWISATPGSTVDLVVREPNQPDFTVQLTADSIGETSYDFPDHRGRVVSISLTQDYLTATGSVRSDAIYFVSYPIPAY